MYLRRGRLDLTAPTHQTSDLGQFTNSPSQTNSKRGSFKSSIGSWAEMELNSTFMMWFWNSFQFPSPELPYHSWISRVWTLLWIGIELWILQSGSTISPSLRQVAPNARIWGYCGMMCWIQINDKWLTSSYKYKARWYMWCTIPAACFCLFTHTDMLRK